MLLVSTGLSHFDRTSGLFGSGESKDVTAITTTCSFFSGVMDWLLQIENEAKLVRIVPSIKANRNVLRHLMNSETSLTLTFFQLAELLFCLRHSTIKFDQCSIH